MKTLRAVPVTAEAFAPYGQAASDPGPGNRTDYAAKVVNGRPGLDVNLGVVRAHPPKSLPLSVAKMERHPLSSQAFLPLDCDRYLVVVAQPRGNGGPPDLATLRAFVVPGDTVINYNPGTWHCPLTSLDRPSTFGLLMYMDGGPGDEDWHALAEPFSVTVD